MAISTRNLESMPKPNDLLRVCKSIAILDAILEPNWEYRYYSFDAHWDDSEQMASMRDGEGSFYFILFTLDGVAIKGFEKDSLFGEYNRTQGKPWPGVTDDVPEEFQTILLEPAFYVGDVTFCCWCQYSDTEWSCGEIEFPSDEDVDGSETQLNILDGKPETFRAWAAEYHGLSIPIELVRKIYNHEPLTDEIVTSLNPRVKLGDLKSDFLEIGLPF